MGRLATADADDACWAAVAGRDRSADGRFLFAVTTTGVFCRPGCPSRTPNRANVRVFETAAEARAAGFRPCRRCRPEQDRGEDATLAAVRRACRRIEDADALPSLAELARDAGLGPHHFHRTFKAIVGVTPRAYAAEVRAGRARRALRSGSSVTLAITEVGYASHGRFYEEAPRMLGMTPTQYRDRAENLVVRLAIEPCPLGLVLVAATDRGVCMIAMGEDPEALLAEFGRDFAGARVVPDDPAFREWVSRVVAHLEMPARGLSLPLDVRGTAFSRRVWEELQAIPAGQTRTYTEVAAAIGRPTAARAVARACATNLVSLAIPCHRVVRGDGGLGGYRWGVDRKRRLLEGESLAEG